MSHDVALFVFARVVFAAYELASDGNTRAQEVRESGAGKAGETLRGKQ